MNKLVNISILKKRDKEVSEKLRILKEKRDHHLGQYNKYCFFIKNLEFSKVNLKKSIKEIRRAK